MAGSDLPAAAAAATTTPDVATLQVLSDIRGEANQRCRQIGLLLLYRSLGLKRFFRCLKADSLDVQLCDLSR